MRHRAIYHDEFGIASIPSLPAGTSDYSLGVIARVEYETFANGVPNHISDTRPENVLNRPNGNPPIPEDKVEDFLTFDHF